MPRLSLYSNFDYPDGEQRVMPWEFWTDEERSLVIRNAYKDTTLTSKEVKSYLDASRKHFYTQWLIPLAAAGVIFGPLRVTLLSKAYGKHPSVGFRYSAFLTTGVTLFWLNLSPYYIQKESEQVRTLKIIWSKIGVNIKTYNNIISKTTTSTNIDKDTWSMYQARNRPNAELYGPEEDQAHYFLPDNKGTNKIKKIIF